MAQIAMREDVPKFGWKDKIGYALGDFGCNLSFVLQSSFFMVYYVTCLGIDATHFGIIILLAKVWDGVNDPLVGALTDRIRPKNNKEKFKPWIFYGSIFLTAVTIFMFAPIHDAPYWLRLVACAASYVLWDMCYTVVNVPYGSMASVMTTNDVERAELSTWRSIGSLLGNVPAVVILPLVLYNANSDPIQDRFFWAAVVMALLGFACLRATCKMCTERVVHVEEEDAPKGENANFFRTFISCLKSRPMIGLVLSSVALLMFMQSNNNTNQYVFMLYYQDTTWISLTMVISYGAQCLMMLFIKPLINHFDRKTLCSVPFAAIIAIALFMLLTPVENPLVWAVCTALIAVLQGGYALLMWSLISDCIDYMELKTGRREEGSVYSSVTLFRKIGSGVGTAAMGVLIDAVGYDQTVSAAAQAAGVGLGIKNMAAGYLLVGAVIIFVSMTFIYNLDDKAMKDVQAKLGRAEE